MNRPLRIAIVERYNTQADFAQAIGCDDARVSRVVRGRKELSPEEREKWAHALNREAEDLFPSETANVGNQAA